MSLVAVGIKHFSRTSKLEQLLRSINSSVINKVYIADDGKDTKQKYKLYNSSYEFDLEVLDLEFDTGLGYGRKKIVENLSEDYLLLVDNDMVLPQNIDILLDQLELNPKLGGVSGCLIEDDQIRAMTHDLFEVGDLLVRDIREKKEIQYIAGHPFVEFDLVPNAAMFRRECVKEYTWDENYKIGFEHLDFYLGHKKQTDWKFGVSPQVMFQHNPGGDTDYLKKRQAESRLKDSKHYFLEKWGYTNISNIRGSWFTTYQPGLNPVDHVGSAILRASTFTPPAIQKRIAAIERWSKDHLF